MSQIGLPIWNPKLKSQNGFQTKLLNMLVKSKSQNRFAPFEASKWGPTLTCQIELPKHFSKLKVWNFLFKPKFQNWFEDPNLLIKLNLHERFLKLGPKLAWQIEISKFSSKINFELSKTKFQLSNWSFKF
jgi:hypothetical protein